MHLRESGCMCLGDGRLEGDVLSAPTPNVGRVPSQIPEDPVASVAASEAHETHPPT